MDLGRSRRAELTLLLHFSQSLIWICEVLELAVLAPQTIKLLALHRCQAILAAVLITVGLCTGR
jgi:hypothetical protein